MAKSSQQMYFVWPEQCLKNFFELVASILKLKFHIKFWILWLLLKKTEIVDTGSTAHIITSHLELCDRRHTERARSSPGCPFGLLHPLCVLSLRGNCLVTPDLKCACRSDQWCAGKCLTTDEGKEKNPQL